MLIRGSARPTGVLFVLIAGVLWGTIGVAVDQLYALGTTTPLSVLFFRFLFACPVLLSLLVFRQGGASFRVKRSDLVVMLLMGGMLAISQLFYFAAIREAGVAVATLVTICVAPIVVALASTVLFKELLTRSILVSLALSVLGITLMIDFDGTLARSSGWGVVIALGAAFAFAAFILAGRFLAKHTRALQSNTIAICAGTLLLVPMVLSVGLDTSFTPMGWWLLIYLGVVTTAMAYWVFVIGIQTVRATTASILTLVDPLVATVLAYALVGERLATNELIGSSLLVIAFVVEIRRRE